MLSAATADKPAPASAAPSASASSSIAPASGAVDIKSARSSSFNAPTPANTPSAASAASSALQKFSLASEKGGVRGGAASSSDSFSAATSRAQQAPFAMPANMPADIAAAMAQNPQMMQALQGRLEGLVGKSSGYIESLPAPVKRRLNALKQLVHTQADLEAKFRLEVLELEKKYLKMYSPLYSKRSLIIQGKYEPTDAECEVEDSDVDDDEAEEDDDGAKADAETAQPSVPAPFDENVKGVPEFWLTVFKTSPILEQLITERDEGALVHLIDVRASYADSDLELNLEFEFAPNDYFTDAVLTKSYQLKNEVDPDFEDITFGRATGCTINWKPGKDLTKTVEMRKQRHKSSQKTRIVKKTVPAESFFNFFEPPTLPDDFDEEEDEEQLDAFEDALETDYEIADHFVEAIIPRAVDWFTGKALDNYQDDDQEDDDDEEDGDHDGYSDEDDDDDDESDDSDKGTANAASARNNNTSTQNAVAGTADKPAPECKQQ